jgi:hypothetical protein
VIARKTQWAGYTSELAGLTGNAIKTVHEAAQRVSELRALLDHPELLDNESRRDNNQQIKWHLLQVSQSIRALTGKMTNAMETGLVGDFDFFKDALVDEAKSTGAKQDRWKKLLDEVNKLDEKIHQLALKGSANMAFLAHAIDETARESKTDTKDKRKPLQAAIESPQSAKVASAFKDWTESSEGAPGPGTNLSSRVAALTPPRDHNDLDREQDPADPLWRILSNSRNNSKWHSAFATNYFFSEGNNSVVIVRDSPIHYRVHSADNNPTALIQGQLRISRAVADAAIQIAGTAAGVKMPDLLGKPPEPVPGPGGTTTTNETAKPDGTTKPNETAKTTDGGKTVSLATAEATIDAEIANRAASLRSLNRSLASLRSEFERAGTNNISRTNLLGQFESLLKAYSRILKPEDTKSADEKPAAAKP